MNRVDLLAAMKCASGALALRDYAPAFASFFFDGERVCAYGDEIAITTRCKFPVQGGIIGKVMLAWVGACGGDEVESECADGEATLRCGRSKITLPLLPSEQLIYEAPQAEAGICFDAPFDLLTAIKRCGSYVGDDPTHPWRMGLTLSYKDGAFNLYSTTDAVLVHARADNEDDESDSAYETILPERFVSLLLQHAQTNSLAAIRFGLGWAEATFDDDVVIFTKTGSESKPSAYEDIMGQLFDKATFVEVESIVSSLLFMMERVAKVGMATGQDRAVLGVRGRSLSVTLSGGSASLMDSLPFPGDHESIKVEIAPSSMLAILPHVKEMSVTDRAVLFTGSGFDAAIAALVVQ